VPSFLAECRRRCQPALLALAALLLAGAAPPSYWGQAQSHMEALDGAPLLAATWSGRSRPWVWRDGRFVLLADSGVPPGLDLYRPLPLSATELLLAGTEAGHPWFDLFLYDLGSRTLTNLTDSAAVDDGGLCLHAPSRRVAWRAGRGERFAVVADGELRPLASDAVPGFVACAFDGPDTILGAGRRPGGWGLARCRVEGEAVGCAPGAALDDVDAFVKFVRTPEGPGVIARRRGEPFRRPYRIDGDRLVPLPVPDGTSGDVLDWDDGAVRTGSEGRYRSSLAPDFPGVVYATRRIGDAWYAIVATARTPRTLARLDGARWTLFAAPGVTVPEDVPALREVWMRSPGGTRCQAFAFGPDAPEKVVVWWHGGPEESVSPRFNPYFTRLAAMGWGVLAVNYPGSTGRGAEWEARFEPGAVGECLDAVWANLRAEGVRRIVSWSVSAGIAVQRVLLARGLPVSGIIDQAGVGPGGVVEAADAKGVPLFTIRGRNDPSGPVARVDFWYPGGHDVATAQEFEALFEAVAPFLAGARPVFRGTDGSTHF
jgi:dipeptidyl aminopeptidase/acylaminoacyl peptidase